MSAPQAYRGSITREQWLVNETRTVARLMLDEGIADTAGLVDAVVSANPFQYPTERELKSITRACARRLAALSDDPQLRRRLVELIRSRFGDPDFLRCRGISNEVPFYVFPYDAACEDEVRERTAELVAASRAGSIPARIVDFDLWEIFCGICGYYDIVDDLERMERERGSEALLAHIRELAMPEDYVRAMRERYERDFGGMQAGRDVLLVTGVGKTYPFVRAHDILENAQPAFDGVPFVLFFPGLYDQTTLRLFNSVADGNYYRAFTLL